MLLDNQKTLALMKRVYNNKMEETDAKDINTFIKEVFGDNGKTPNKALLQQFNQLVVEQADALAKPIVSDVVGLFANVKFQRRGNLVKYNLPRNGKGKFIWSANGSEVDLIRIEDQKSRVAIPSIFKTGFTYNPEELVEGGEEAFRDLINSVKTYKVDLYMAQILAITEKAVASAVVPEANKIEASNATIKDFNKLSGVISRFGGRPLFVADPLLVNHFAMQQATTEGLNNLITEDYKGELLNELNVTTVGRATAFNLVNPFKDEANTITELPVNVGFMLSGEGRNKPFSIVEYGEVRIEDNYDFASGTVQVKVALDAAIDLVYANSMGFIKDTSITL